MNTALLPRPARVLAAGHGYQFFDPVEGALRDGGAVVRRDCWWGHDDHDSDRSMELAAWADTILCEWCLGNAVFFARNRRPGQRLVVHFHRFELDTAFPERLDIDRVDLVVFAGPHFRDAAVERFGWPESKCVYLPNAVDVAAFDTRKAPEASRTLGILGWHRQLKRLDLALDLLEDLLADDDRWRLRAKGARPEDVDWIWRDPSEREYFTEQFARIEASPALREAVVFDAFGPVAEWFAGVGFILSPSDVESFHLAVAEGMASAAVPVIWRRDGTERLFEQHWTHKDTASAAAAVRGLDGQARRAQGERARAFVAAHYDRPQIAAAWRSAVIG